jgi:hypothetical protein
MAGNVKVTVVEDSKRVEYRHAKCGALLIRDADEAEFAPDQDCGTCEEIKGDYQRWGMQRASAGTKLAEEIHQVFKVGEVGAITK